MKFRIRETIVYNEIDRRMRHRYWVEPSNPILRVLMFIPLVFLFMDEHIFKSFSTVEAAREHIDKYIRGDYNEKTISIEKYPKL